jgi:diguanylate cyclase (GGDEF)-like protein/PAS domain S-box-containing protein
MTPYVHPGANPESLDDRQSRDAGVRPDGKAEADAIAGDSSEKFTRMLDVRRDIPEPERAEQTLRRLNRELRAISSCHQTIMRALDEQTLLNDVCRIVCEEAGYLMAWVGFAEYDEAKTVRPVASAGFDDGYLEQAKVTWADTERGRGPASTAIRTGETVCTQDHAADPRAAPWRAEALRRGYRASIALPLKNESASVFGALNIYSTELNAFTAEEIRLLEELAGDLAFGVRVLRTRAERKDAHRRLQANLHFFECMDRINLAIQETKDVELMMNQVLGVTLSIFECDRAWLVYPCDPNAAARRVAMERTRPEYPGNGARGLEIPTNSEVVGVMSAVLGAHGPVSFDPGSERSVPEGLRGPGFDIQSMLCMAVHPRTGNAYMFGLHQCSRLRIWTEDEKTLLQEIGRRLADGLSSLHAFRDLRDREGQLHTLVQTIPDLVWLKDANGVYLRCNPQFERLAGVRERDIVGKTAYDFNDKDRAENIGESDRQAMATDKPGVKEEWLTFAADGYRGLFEVIRTPMRDQAGKPNGLLGIARDITERKKAEEQLRIAAAAFEAQEGIVIVGADKRILRVNRAFTEITGYTTEDIMGKTPDQLRSGEHDDAFYQAIWDRIAGEGSWKGEIWYRRKCGELYPSWFNAAAVKRENGEITHYVATLIDLTERKAAEKRIERLAFYDPLTQLPNRRLFLDRLQQALAGCARSGRKGALLFIDLDNFKILNETASHDVGDQLLVEVARRIAGCVRNGDTVARLGGDEFVVLLEELSENLGEAAAQTEEIAERALSALGSPYTIAGRAHDSTASIGVTLFIDAVDSLDELLKQADIAMYQAKSAGRNALRFFDPGMQGALAARTALEAALRLAIRDRQFVLHYQPQVDGAGRFIGAEALLRWRCPERGLVAPGEFIPLAEETGLILPIGQWVLEAACSQLVDWADDPRARELPLSINVSARQFRQPDFVDQVRRTLERAGAPAAKLKLELTESLVIDDVEGTIEKMRALKRLGVGFSMDDFGTGYSSLSYLTRLPLDQIKIDRSFVRNLPDSANDAAVSQTIITLAKSLGLAVIAEGVETEAQRRFLASQGCPTYQGFLFSPPVDIALFERLLG